jgi:hypothetical protein
LAYISVCILVLYTAFNSAADVESELMEKEGFGHLGYYVLAILYFFMGLGSIISTAAINKFGTRWCLVFGGIGCVISLIASLMGALY